MRGSLLTASRNESVKLAGCSTAIISGLNLSKASLTAIEKYTLECIEGIANIFLYLKIFEFISTAIVLFIILIPLIVKE